MTPGTYLRLRREAAGVPIEKIAAQVWTDPRVSQRDRGLLIAAIEEDLTPAAAWTLAALRRFYRFDPAVYELLVRSHHHGQHVDCPPICTLCGCTENDACQVDQAGWRSATGGLGCWWVEPDLCSACDRRHPDPESEQRP
ncbi:MAG: helix-turn-helix domain-containing protein [Sphingomonas sp.]